MKNQNFANHAQYRPLHHFIITPLTLIAAIWSVIHAFGDNLSAFDRVFPVVLSFAVLLLSVLTRLYGNENQDRVIRMELRLRYFHLTGKSFAEKEEQLQRGQMVALRFASDEEFLPLIDRAIAEGLKSKEIKASIQNWQGDYWRI